MKSRVQSPISFVKSTTEVKKSKVIEMRGTSRGPERECDMWSAVASEARHRFGTGAPHSICESAVAAPLCRRTPYGVARKMRPATRDTSGVALVITLILLSVITFMAITFLVVSRGEKSTVGSVTEQTTARLAAETSLEMANNAIIAPILAFTNPYGLTTIVSTNYINSLGFNTAGGLRAYLTNVSYTYPNGTPLNNFNDTCQNIANLFYLPPVPVYITNRLTGSNQFASYVDLNRNGRFEPSGWVIATNYLGQPIPNGTNGFVTNFVMGDPQWIGILERGNYTPALYNPVYPSSKNPIFPVGMPHSADNLFISRYAYLVIPTSTTLDLNYIHNYAKELANLMPLDGYWRNQGVGSWEVNLAAFLADLNPNIWNTNAAPYIYNKSFTAYNGGVAFDDAAALLRYRYGRSWRNLPTVVQNFGLSGSNAFWGDWVDGYTVGLMTGPLWTPAADSDRPRLGFSWSGSDNPSNFFDLQDLYDSSKTGIGVTGPTFTDRLKLAGNSVSTFDRYTFYRLAGQMALDSAPESPKINLNFANVDTNTGAIVPNMATNFAPWQPVVFFTNAAARMLADAGYGTNIVDYVGGIPRIHIQIYPTNYYTPSVHRYLQLAANIYDANVSANVALNALGPTNGNGFPSVFRPLFLDEANAKGGSNRVWITGYAEVIGADPTIVPAPYPASATNSGQLRPYHDLAYEFDPRPVRPTDMVYGVPLVIGAKKGFPNFNEFGLLQDISVARNLIYHRLGPQAFNTNQIYTMGISNVFSVEAWNSYSNTYPGQLQMVAIAEVITAVTNEAGICKDRNNFPLTNIYTVATNMPIMPAYSWIGYRGANASIPIQRASFRFPLGGQTYLYLTNSDFAFNQNRFLPSSQLTTDPMNYFPVPRWKVKLTARARFMLVDRAANRIVDYVNLSEAREPVDVAELLKGTDRGGEAPCDGNFNRDMGSLFCTNRPGASLSLAVPTYGIINQIRISMGSLQVDDTFWTSFNAQTRDRSLSTKEFNDRILSSTDTTLDFAAPFAPRRIIHHSVSWQANDPLVHYVFGDLQDPLSKKRQISYDTVNGLIDPTSNPLIGFPVNGQTGVSPLNQHYRPWKGRPGMPDSDPPTATRLELKDPLIMNSDSWSFMTNRFPNVGWLGRVHRGTPWQTVFLKSANIDFNTWTNWVGNNWWLVNHDGAGSSNYDAAFSMPTNDYRILDLFTTAFNENASKGQMSVNQTNLAAWSAILSGLIVNTDGTTNGFTWIEPACVDQANGVNPPRVQQIVDGINRARANPTNYPYGQFTRRGDILSVPELTMASPYIPTNSNPNQALPDWVYERIPQQIMSLLRGGDEPPRFVVYAFGQALKPAEHSLVTASGPFFGLCTNYQVTAESVIRAVVRVDNAPTPRAPNNIPRVYVESFNVLAPY